MNAVNTNLTKITEGRDFIYESLKGTRENINQLTIGTLEQIFSGFTVQQLKKGSITEPHGGDVVRFVLKKDDVAYRVYLGMVGSGYDDKYFGVDIIKQGYEKFPTRIHNALIRKGFVPSDLMIENYTPPRYVYSKTIHSHS